MAKHFQNKKNSFSAITLLFLLSILFSFSCKAAALTPGTYRIVSAAGKLYSLQTENGSRERGANMEVNTKAENGTDIFRIRKVSGKYCRIDSLFSGLTLTIDDQNVIQSKWKKKNTQLWEAQSDESGKIFLISKTGLYLGIEKKKAGAGVNVCAREASSKAAVKWILQPVSDLLTVSAQRTVFSGKASSAGITVCATGTWKAKCTSRWISLKKSGSLLIISCKKNAGDEREAEVTVKSGSASAVITVTQKSQEDSNGSKTLAKGTYYFLSALDKGRYSLSVHNGKKKDGVNVQLALLSGDVSRLFKLKYAGDGAYAILAKCSGKCLQANGLTGNVEQGTYKGYSHQLWIVEEAGNDYYYLRSKESGLYLAVCQNTAGEGVNVIVQKRKSRKCQRWKLLNSKSYSPGFQYLWKNCQKADVTDAFLEKTLRISNAIGADPDDLMSVMAFESSLDHTAVNPNSGATGLIQFLPSTASRLGTSTSALKAMSAIDQLDYVYTYLSSYAGHYSTLGSLYMAVLWPTAVGQGDNYVLWRKGGTYDAQYSRNSRLDVNHDGAVTVGEAVQKVLAQRKNFVGE